MLHPQIPCLHPAESRDRRKVSGLENAGSRMWELSAVKKRPAGQSCAPCGVRCLNLCGRGAGQQMQIAEI